MKYIKLKNKKAIHEWKQENDRYTYNEVAEYEEIGKVVPKNVIVLDYDRKVDYRLAVKFMEKMNIETQHMESNKGGHIYFSTTKKYKNGTQYMNMFGQLDIKSGTAYTRIRDKGKDFHFEHLDTIQPMHDAFKPVKLQHKVVENLKNVSVLEEGGRNDELFKLACNLNGPIGVDINYLHFFNDQLRNKLETNEINTIIKSAKGREEIIAEKPYYNEKGHLDKTAFLNYIVENILVTTYADGIYIYAEDEWRVFNHDVGMIYLLESEGISYPLTCFTKETYRWCLANFKKEKKHYEVSQYVHKYGDTYFDVSTFQEVKYVPSPDTFIVSKLDVKYDKDAYCPIFDKFLTDVSDDPAVRKVLIETLAVPMLIDPSIFHKAIILYGKGGTGKSVFLKTLTNFYGNDNVLQRGIQQMGEKHAFATFQGKRLIIGSDMENYMVDKSSSFKNITSGDPISIEPKGVNPIDVKPAVLFVGSTNNVLEFSDKSDGVTRRIHYVVFNKNFSESADRDIHLADKLQSERTKSYILNLILARLQEGITEFTETIDGNEILKEFNPMTAILDFINAIHIEDQPVANIKELYEEFCETNGHKVLRNYGKMIESTDKYYRKAVKLNGKTVKVWRAKC